MNSSIENDFVRRTEFGFSFLKINFITRRYDKNDIRVIFIILSSFMRRIHKLKILAVLG